MLVSFTEIMGQRGALEMAQRALCHCAATIEERERQVSQREAAVYARECTVLSNPSPYPHTS